MTKKNSPFFSVVITVYNKEKYILKTLNSVLHQSCTDFEVVIVNDGSSDNSLEVVNSISDDRIVVLEQKNTGASEARNNGIRKAVGKYICLLDGDDIWYTDHLETFKKSIEKFTTSSVFCINYEIKFGEGNIVKASFSNMNYKSNVSAIKLNDYFLHCYEYSLATSSTICIKKEVFDNNTFFFDKKITSGQDTDLWIRLALVYDFVYNTKITALINKGIPDSLSKSNNAQSRYLVTQNFLKDEKTNPSLKKYMDLNRFSVLVKLLSNNLDNKKNQKLKEQISSDSLNLKQRFLLSLPSKTLRFFLRIKEFLAKKGFYFSVFN